MLQKAKQNSKCHMVYIIANNLIWIVANGSSWYVCREHLTNDWMSSAETRRPGLAWSISLSLLHNTIIYKYIQNTFDIDPDSNDRQHVLWWWCWQRWRCARRGEKLDEFGSRVDNNPFIRQITFSQLQHGPSQTLINAMITFRLRPSPRTCVQFVSIHFETKNISCLSSRQCIKW